MDGYWWRPCYGRKSRVSIPLKAGVTQRAHLGRRDCGPALENQNRLSSLTSHLGDGAINIDRILRENVAPRRAYDLEIIETQGPREAPRINARPLHRIGRHGDFEPVHFGA